MEKLFALGFDLLWILAALWLLRWRFSFPDYKSWIIFNLLFALLLLPSSCWVVESKELFVGMELRCALLYFWALSTWALVLLHFAYVRKAPLLSFLYAGFFFLWIFVRLFLLHPNLEISSMQILLVGFTVASALFYWTLFKNRGFNIKEHRQ